MTLRALLARHRPSLHATPQGSRNAWRFFLLACLIAFGIKCGFTALVVLERPMPIDPDDSFARIFQGVRNLHCFTQQCAALESLRQQATAFPGVLSTADYPLWDIWSRVSFLSELLPGGLILALHRLGLSLVDSHDLMLMVHGVLLVSGIGYWLLVTFGPGPAGIALLLLTIKWDLTPILSVTNEGALGLSMLAWAEIRRRGAASAPLLFVLIFLMSGWHMIGKMWSVVTLIVLAWFAGRPLTGTETRWITASLAILVLAFLLPPLLVSGTGIPTLDGITGHSPMELFSFHWPAIRSSLNDLIVFYKHPWYLTILLGLGIFSLSLEERNNTLFWLLLFAALLTAGLIDHQTAHPGHLFLRIWTPFFILLTGIIAHGIHHWGGHLGHLIQEAWRNTAQTPAAFRNLFVLMLMLGFTLAMTDQFLFQARTTIHHYPALLRHNLTRHEYLLLPSQPARLLAQDPPCRDVLYTDVTLVVHYLSHGAYRCGALAATGSDETNAWLASRTGITHLVTWSPVRKHYGRLPIIRRHPILMHPTDNMTTGTWHVGLHNPNKTTVRVRLRPATGDAGPTLEKELPPGWSGWWEIGQVTGSRQAMELAPSGESEVLMTGVRIGPPEPAGLRWPWDQGITLDIADAKAQDGRRRIPFRSAELWPVGIRSVTVLDDTGSSVLAAVHRPSGA